MKFGEKVRDLRKKHSLTQDELAQCLGINKRTIIGWERDGRYPRSIEMLEKMADIFHVPLTYLQPDQSLFIERAAEAYGKKGKIEAQHLAFELTELFASGELTPQDMDGIMYEMHKAYMDLHTLNKFLTIKDKHILLYEHNAFTSHLMLDSDKVYQMTKRGLDAAQIATVKKIHLNLVLVKLLELHHLGYDLRHYHEQHHAFIEHFKLPRYFRFDAA